MTGATRRRGWRAGLWVLLAVALTMGGGYLVWSGLQERPPGETPEPSRQFSMSAEEAIAARPSAAPDVEPLVIEEEAKAELGPFVRTEPVEEPPADGDGGGSFVSRLQIPSIYVDAGIVNQGVSADNAMTLPRNLSKVGLLNTVQPLRAGTGSTLLAGHVVYSGDRGALYYLGEVEPGASISTWDDRGRRQEWVVSGVHLYRQTELPDRLFATDGERRLHLVTCGGDFIRTSRGWIYSDNIVVTAVPVS
ncbi:sortase [Tessaracoccus sp. MC1865]|uniref:sortase domain-containing protein n=1 Tax=unclassified Tessaracoccus TaxID=2635419 RepID=UPI001602C427|nr:sortase [Tessaracoccus sp. MC1865]MBB1482899.1 sortase [Tessaracoccus sp. MC1865]MBB1510506.1 sortase [Tessaracoccus sp. MC1756]QTO37662.1 sortase [Tessaracoccus sp. MC1865]